MAGAVDCSRCSSLFHLNPGLLSYRIKYGNLVKATALFELGNTLGGVKDQGTCGDVDPTQPRTPTLTPTLPPTLTLILAQNGPESGQKRGWLPSLPINIVYML